MSTLENSDDEGSEFEFIDSDIYNKFNRKEIEKRDGEATEKKIGELSERIELLESKIPFPCDRRDISEDTLRALSHTRYSFLSFGSLETIKYNEKETIFLENYYSKFLEKNGIGALEGIEKRVWEEYVEFCIRDAAKKEDYLSILENHVSETLEIIATDGGELFDEIDVKFDLGNGNIYSEIRAFFAVHSEVFKAMLFGKMQESKKYSLIPLEDVPPKTMEYLKVTPSPLSSFFLSLPRDGQALFYGLRPRIKDYPKEIVSIFHFADKYLFKDLRTFCKTFCKNKCAILPFFS